MISWAFLFAKTAIIPHNHQNIKQQCTMPSPANQRGTDEAFLQLMELSGAGLLKLAGFPADVAEQYVFRAVEFKHKTLQRPDVEGIPVLEAADTRAIIEFQGYHDPNIRYRTLNEMLLAYLKSKERKPVVGIIVYTHERYQRVAQSLSKNLPRYPSDHLPLKEIVLTSYTEQQLVTVDPRLIVLAPFTISKHADTPQLQQKARQWREDIEHAYTDEVQRRTASDLLGLLILHLFRHLEQQEVIDMLNLDLMKSRAVQQIHEAAMAQGEAKKLQELREQILKTLQQRFQQSSDETLKQLSTIDSLTELLDLFLLARTCETLELFEKQLQALN